MDIVLGIIYGVEIAIFFIFCYRLGEKFADDYHEFVEIQREIGKKQGVILPSKFKRIKPKKPEYSKIIPYKSKPEYSKIIPYKSKAEFEKEQEFKTLPQRVKEIITGKWKKQS